MEEGLEEEGDAGAVGNVGAEFAFFRVVDGVVDEPGVGPAAESCGADCVGGAGGEKGAVG